MFQVFWCSWCSGVPGDLVFQVFWCSRCSGVPGVLVFWCSRCSGVQSDQVFQVLYLVFQVFSMVFHVFMCSVNCTCACNNTYLPKCWLMVNGVGLKP